MAATLALALLELQGIERRRLQRAEEGVAQEMGGLKRVQGQITSQEQVEESREVAKDLHLDQEREVHKDQGPLLENQEVEEVESKVEVVESKLEEAEGKGEEVEVVEKQLPALERNCRLASTSARVSTRESLARVWLDVQSVAPSDQRKPIKTYQCTLCAFAATKYTKDPYYELKPQRKCID